MRLLYAVGRFFARIGRGLFSLVRDDAYTELRATYPELNKPTGQESATTGSVTTSLTGLGSG